AMLPELSPGGSVSGTSRCELLRIPGSTGLPRRNARGRGRTDLARDISRQAHIQHPSSGARSPTLPQIHAAHRPWPLSLWNAGGAPGLGGNVLLEVLAPFPELFDIPPQLSRSVPGFHELQQWRNASTPNQELFVSTASSSDRPCRHGGVTRGREFRGRP